MRPIHPPRVTLFAGLGADEDDLWLMLVQLQFPKFGRGHGTIYLSGDELHYPWKPARLHYPQQQLQHLLQSLEVCTSNTSLVQRSLEVIHKSKIVEH